MKNIEWLEKLKRNVDEWNTWRTNISAQVSIDFTDASLAGANLYKADLKGVNFAGADLRNADLTGANLFSVNLTGADLTGADLSRANLQNADFTDTLLSCTNFTDADLSRADLRNTNLIDIDLSGTVLIGVDLSNKTLTSIDLSKTNLSNAILKGTILAKAKLVDTNLYGADLTGASLRYADLTGADLGKTNIIKADLTGASLTKAYVDSDTTFSSSITTDCKIERYQLERLLDYGGLSRGERMDMIIEDSVATLRASYSGFWMWIHLIALIIFLFPYLWFVLEQWRVAQFNWPETANTIPLWKALATYIYNGGIDWKDGFTFHLSFLAFVFLFFYNCYRAVLLWKTKQLELLQEARGLPVKFSLDSNYWGTSYKLMNWLVYINFSLAFLNTIHFMSKEILLLP